MLQQQRFVWDPLSLESDYSRKGFNEPLGQNELQKLQNRDAVGPNPPQQFKYVLSVLEFQAAVKTG